MENKKPVLRGEAALLLVVALNSLGVVMMLYSGSGISSVSSVPYAFSQVFPLLSLGTWTYIFQSVLVLSLMLLRRRFEPEYLFSFVVGFAFGVMVDVHKSWISVLPQTLPLRILYFLLSYCIFAVGIALSNRCKLPIIPTDLFPRELQKLTGASYTRVKTIFDVLCLMTTAVMTFAAFGQIRGLGIGTVLAAFTLGRAVDLAGAWLDRRVCFTSVVEQRQKEAAQLRHDAGSVPHTP